MKRKVIEFLLISLLIAMILFPMIYMIGHSLKGKELITLLYGSVPSSIWHKIIIKPFYINLDQYYDVFFRTPRLLYMFWNSVWIVMPVILGQVTVAFFAAYGFSKMKFPGSKTLFFIYIVLMLMPFQVTLVPNYIMLNKLELLDTKLAIILPGIFSTFSVFFLKQFIEGIDNSFLEEGRLLGANEVQILRYIILPMCKPIMMSVIVFVFIDYWSMVEQPIIFLKTPEKYPLSVYLGTITSNKIEIGFASSVFYMILPVCLALYAQNDLSDGLRITNLK